MGVQQEEPRMAVNLGKKPTAEADAPLQVVELPVNSLEEYPNNPRQNDAAVPDMVKLINKFGFRQPILVRGKRIVDGHLRIKAARKLGMDTVPVIDVGDMSEADERALRLAMNKSVEWADWDHTLLAQEFEAIQQAGVGLEFTGFDTKLIDKIYKDAMAANSPAKSADADAGNPADPNYVSLTFHMASTSRGTVRAYLKKVQEDNGLANLSQALIHVCKG